MAASSRGTMADMSSLERPEPSPRRGSSLTARLVSLPLAVALWLLTMGGLALHGQAQVEFMAEMSRTFNVPDIPSGWTLGGTALLVAVAILWAVLTAWSSVGTVVIGIATIVAGVSMGFGKATLWVFERTAGLDFSAHRLVPIVLTPDSLTLLGSLLLAAGLGVALVRRRR